MQKEPSVKVSSGKVAMSTKSATIYDVALLAGVSRGTVTRVLAGSGYASAEARAKVMQAVEQLGYQPNSSAQQLVQGRCRQTIAVYTASMDMGVGNLTINFIQGGLLQKGFYAPLHTLNSTVGEDVALQITILREIRRQKPRALICNADGLQAAAVEELCRFQDEGGVLVCYTSEPVAAPCDTVFFDFERNTYQAARHLLEHGHRAIAYCHHGPLRPGHARERGFRRAHAELGVPVREEWLLQSKEIYEAGGAQHAAKFLALPERPTGVCIVNDVSAATFVLELLRAGVRVPEDVSVVSHDDMPAARYAAVPLTTVSQPPRTIADHVVEMMLSRIEGDYDGAPRTIEICGELVQRQSVAAPPNLTHTTSSYKKKDRVLAL